MLQGTMNFSEPCNYITQHILFMAIQMIMKYINYCYFDVLCDHSFKASWVNCQFHQVTNANRFTVSLIHSIVSTENLR